MQLIGSHTWIGCIARGNSLTVIGGLLGILHKGLEMCISGLNLLSSVLELLSNGHFKILKNVFKIFNFWDSKRNLNVQWLYFSQSLALPPSPLLSLLPSPSLLSPLQDCQLLSLAQLLPLLSEANTRNILSTVQLRFILQAQKQVVS